MKLAAVALFAASAACAGVQCPPGTQELRSTELRELAAQDQADRAGPFDSVDWSKVSPRDDARRARVGVIASLGCLASASDYASAGLVYQHGSTPDDFFHAYQWFQKAVELGDASQRVMVAKGADRFLVNSGYKQLFATQASKPSMNPADCWCLEPVAPGFTPAQRAAYAERTLKEAFAWVDSLNAGAKSCGPAASCAKELKDPPAGLLPGIW